MRKFSYYDPAQKFWSGKPHTPLYNPDSNVGQTILQRLIQQPKSIFQVCDDPSSILTNFEAYRRSLKFAQFLTKSGLKQGDVVGTIVSNNENLAPLMFACFTIGVAVNPLAIIMNEKDIGFMWAKTKPKIVFCDGKIAKTVGKALIEIKSDAEIWTMVEKVETLRHVDEILDEKMDIEKFEFPNLPNISSTIALIMCSSGTTSAPKGICKSHKQIITQIYPTFPPNLVQSDVIFSNVPSFWISHMLLLLYSALYGIKYVITSRSITPDLWMDIIDKHKVTIGFCSPPLGKMLLSSPNVRKMTSPRFVFVAGTVFTEQLIAGLKNVFPNAQIRGAYATTEGDCISASDERGIQGTSSGVPLGGVRMKIIDESGQSLGPNQLGEICYKTPVPFSSYFNDPDKYKLAFDPEGFVFSGDVGYFDDQGQIYIIDRIKHMLKVKGFQITPLELETIICEVDGVRKCCVVGVFDEKLFDDIIHAFVIKDESKQELTEQFIKNYVNSKVIEVKKITGGVHFVSEFPTTPSGKILNRELKKIAAEGFGRGSA